MGYKNHAFARQQILSSAALFEEKFDISLVRDAVAILKRDASMVDSAMPILMHSNSMDDLDSGRKAINAKIKLFTTMCDFVEALREAKALGAAVDDSIKWST